MSYITILYSILAVIGTLVLGLIIGTLLPGIERKYIQARIQQRIGPPVTSPGIMAPIKFFFKENIAPNSPVPGLYKSLPIICFIVVLLILLVLTPQMYFLGGLASVIAIIGFLKVEEVAYVLMGSLSKSVMSLGLPFPDIVRGAIHPDSERSHIEDLSSSRAFRLIAFGSFPIYLAIFIPVAITGSIFLGDIVAYQQLHGPFILTLAGAIGAIVFFVGYMILLNEYPFAIMKTKADVIEGPYMEYASKYRSFVYLTRGFLIFTLGALFSVLFIGIPPSIFSLGILVNIAVALIFLVLMGILSAFSPVFTYKQFYPVVISVSLLGVLAIVVGLLL
ncbi:NAD(P)H-quinone oxidoreductase subunit 1, chloroplastic [Methanobrevibacter cuticularis]|uniref:NAD(P)H-quinone oxidoreductase subunit 1, chloroplastic n=1 Tax=Methanobrevibacter cuticularis TaxID=47311 RepID=A0A166DK24_9EURY|nr:NADH-quinone oxidoreductase subunit H [Methanobrevibacter cuticularis]KZX15676.1 NAD(P)H-quinone oxidoreductase subunit 1, chloroplastic [Methanobrevibacter cuticularis]